MPSPKKKVPKPEVHPAIKAVRSVTARYPDKVIWPLLISAIGEEPDAERLQECYTKWRLKGYSPTNYSWITEWYAAQAPAPATKKEMKAALDPLPRLDYPLMIAMQEDHPKEMFKDLTLYEQARDTWLSYYKNRDEAEHERCLKEVADYEASSAYRRRFNGKVST